MKCIPKINVSKKKRDSINVYPTENLNLFHSISDKKINQYNEIKEPLILKYLDEYLSQFSENCVVKISKHELVDLFLKIIKRINAYEIIYEEQMKDFVDNIRLSNEMTKKEVIDILIFLIKITFKAK